MLGNLAVSKAAKIAALCVCPIGAAVVTTQVPQVRSAVHRMTAPKHVPARRIAPRIPPVAQTAMATPCPTAIPVVLQQADPLALPLPMLSESHASLSLIPEAGNFPGTRISGVDIAPSPSTEPSGPLPILPEPSSWVQFGLGFAVLGSAIRSRSLRARLSAAKAPEAS